MVLGSAEALKQVVLYGIGIAWVPHMTVSRELQIGELVAVPISDLAIARVRSVVLPHGAQLAPAAAAFLEMVRHSAD